jgi:flagellar P-ring protein precursor FlgI
MSIYRLMVPLIGILLFSAHAGADVRIKDITDFQGTGSNQLTGIGLVIGLDGTGSRSSATQKMAVDMLQKFNVTTSIFSSTPADTVFRSTSISMVSVTAELGPFSRKESRIDVIVSVMDDAKSLKGGTLLLTPLQGADREIYAVAQGPLSIGGFSATGQSASVQKNQLNVGRIPNGATVVKEALGEIVYNGKSRLLLKQPDFNTSRLIARGINERYGEIAHAEDAGAVLICIPGNWMRNSMQFLSELTLLTVTPDMPARVVINERTGTIALGGNVVIHPVSITHGNLVIVTSESPIVSQPPPFSNGNTAIVPRTQLNVTEQKGRVIPIPKVSNVTEVARALNSLGVTPQDLISIFQALKAAGALHAEIVVQ